MTGVHELAVGDENSLRIQYADAVIAFSEAKSVSNVFTSEIAQSYDASRNRHADLERVIETSLTRKLLPFAIAMTARSADPLPTTRMREIEAVTGRSL
jgi:hypothetical protein